MVDIVPLSGRRASVHAPSVWRLDDVTQAHRTLDWLILRGGADNEPIWLDWPLCVAVVAHVRAREGMKPISDTASVVLARVAAGAEATKPEARLTWWSDVSGLCLVGACGVLVGAALTVLVFRALGWAQ